MAVSSPPRGLIIDLITPFKKNGDIDGRGLGKHLDRVLPHVQALLLAGPCAGEGKNLNAAQRDELLEKALVVVRGRLPILVWISQDTEEKTGETLLLLKKRLETQKYTGQVFWVDTPLYYHSNRGLPFHYRNISSIAKEPFILHNDPGLISKISRPLKRANIRTGILKELTRIEDIRGLIFSGSPDRVRNYQKAVRSRTEFRIYDGDESYFLRHPSLSGVVSVGANLAPGSWEKITASSLNLNNNQKAYPDYLRQIWELGEYLRNLRDIYHGNFTHLVKRILHDIGIIEDPSRTSATEDMVQNTRLLKELMERYGDFP